MSTDEVKQYLLAMKAKKQGANKFRTFTASAQLTSIVAGEEGANGNAAVAGAAPVSEEGEAHAAGASVEEPETVLKTLVQGEWVDDADTQTGSVGLHASNLQTNSASSAWGDMGNVDIDKKVQQEEAKKLFHAARLKMAEEANATPGDKTTTSTPASSSSSSSASSSSRTGEENKAAALETKAAPAVEKWVPSFRKAGAGGAPASSSRGALSLDRQAQEFPTLGSGGAGTGKPKAPAATGAWSTVDKSIVERSTTPASASSHLSNTEGGEEENGNEEKAATSDAKPAPPPAEKSKPVYLGADYLPEPGFTTEKPGYDFKSGPLGLGYYWHEYVEPAARPSPPSEGGVDDFGGLKRSANAWKPRSQR